MGEKRKVQKQIKKPCDLCGGLVELVRYEEDNNGVVFEEQYEECTECLNRTKIKRNNHKGGNSKYDW